MKSKRHCPGYSAQFDLVLRDQTRSTQQKVQRQQQRYRTEIQPSNESTEEIRQPHTRSALALACPLTLELRPNSPEDLAVCKFFSTYVFVPRHHESVRDFLDCLPLLFSRAPSVSLVSLATSAVALMVVGGDPSRQLERTLSRQMFGKALLMVHRAIEDPKESVQDDTLMAVLLLGLYEVSPSTCNTYHYWNPIPFPPIQ